MRETYLPLSNLSSLFILPLAWEKIFSFEHLKASEIANAHTIWKSLVKPNHKLAFSDSYAFSYLLSYEKLCRHLCFRKVGTIFMRSSPNLCYFPIRRWLQMKSYSFFTSDKLLKTCSTRLGWEFINFLKILSRLILLNIDFLM